MSEIPRVALTREEAAESLGVSLSSFVRHIAPELPVIRRGGLRLYSVRSLEAWAAESEERTLR